MGRLRGARGEGQRTVRARDVRKWWRDHQEGVPHARPEPIPTDYLNAALVHLEGLAAWRAEHLPWHELHPPLQADRGDGQPVVVDMTPLVAALRTMGDAALERDFSETLEAAWEAARACVVHGTPPEPSLIASLVRFGPIPDDMRMLVADMLEGRLKRRAGRRMTPLLERQWRALFVHRVFRWKRAIEWLRKRNGHSADPYREALLRVKAETGIPESTLDKWCYPRS